MATVNFYIRKSKAQGDSSGVVFFKYHDKGQQFTHTLDYEIEQDRWSEGKLIGGNQHEDTVNLDMSEIRNDVLRIRQSLITYSKGKSNAPTAEQVKAIYLDDVQDPVVESNERTLVDLINKFIHNPYMKKPLAQSTISNYDNTISHLESLAIDRKVNIGVGNLDDNFFVKFQQFSTDDKSKGGLELANGTTNKHVSCIMSAMRHSKSDSDVNLGILEGVSRLYTEENIFYVTYSELEALKLIKFDNPKMNDAVRLYIFASYAPARYKDLWRMAPQHLVDLHGNKMLDFTSGKSKVRTHLPLNKYCLSLIKEMRTDEKLLNVPNRDISEYIHSAFRLSGLFDEYVVKRTFRGLNGEAEEERKQRYQVLNFHTSRHSFASNMIEMEGSSAETLLFLQAAMGHKKIETTMKYVHLDKRKYISSILEQQKGVKDIPNIQLLKTA